MKKSFISLGLIVAATFALTNCAKEFENPSQQPESAGIPFEITASTPDTKTANDGLNTVWVADDAINLFHAVAGAATYINDGEFTVAKDDVDAGRFTGTLGGDLEAGKSYDWYAFYPYSDYIKTPGAQTNGYAYIGCRSDKTQLQVGINNMTHIAGANYPLYGKVLGESADSKPTMTMSHASSLLKINVKNSLDTEVSVTEIAFAAPDGVSLVGTFYPNIIGEKIEFADANYVSNVATLTVQEASIAAGQTGSFYMAIKPIEIETGKLSLTISVSSSKGLGMQTREIDVNSIVKFEAGKFKELNFEYTKAIEAVETVSYKLVESISDVLEDEYVIVSGDYILLNNSGSSKQSVVQYSTYGLSYDENAKTMSGPINDEFRWVVSASNDKIRIASYSDESQYLYTNNANDGLRIGQTDDTWTVSETSDAGVFNLKSTSYDRYVAVYKNQDWRAYTNLGNSDTEYGVQLYRVVDNKDRLDSPVITVVPNSTNDGLILSWTDVDNATEYDVYCSGQDPVSVPAGVETYTIANLEPAEYVVSIRAKASDYKFATSNEMTVKLVDPDAVVKYYEKVTSAPSDWSGTYLLVCESASKVYSGVSTTSTKYGLGESVTIEDGKIEVTDDTEGYQLTIAKATVTSGAYTFAFLDSKYLYWTSGNSLDLNATESAKTNWNITFDSGNVLISNCSTPAREIWWNAGSPRFACYTGKTAGTSYYTIQLYKRQD